MRKDDLAWEKLEANDELPVRAILALWAYPELDDEKQVRRSKIFESNSIRSLIL